MRRDGKVTLAEHLAARIGLRGAIKVLSFMVAWELAAQGLGREPVNVDEYSDWWRQSRSTGYREKALFTKAFPGEESPGRLMAEWTKQVDISRQGAAILLGSVAM